MYCPMPDAHQPRLRSRTSRKELFGGSKRVVPHLELTRFDVYCHDSPAVAIFHLSSYLLFVDCLTNSGELLFAVTRLSCFHFTPPVDCRECL